VTALEGAGARRISTGSALSRAALGTFLKAAREIKDEGSFAFGQEAAGFADLNSVMEG